MELKQRAWVWSVLLQLVSRNNLCRELNSIGIKSWRGFKILLNRNSFSRQLSHVLLIFQGINNIIWLRKSFKFFVHCSIWWNLTLIEILRLILWKVLEIYLLGWRRGLKIFLMNSWIFLIFASRPFTNTHKMSHKGHMHKSWSRH